MKPKLKYNLTLDGCKVSFQVLEQDEELRSDNSNVIKYLFSASNGFKIRSDVRVALYDDGIYIAGRDETLFHDITAYEAPILAKSRYDRFSQALKEFVNAKVLYEIKELEDHATFQVLWQDSEITRIIREPSSGVEFTSKNGWKVRSLATPEICVGNQSVIIRGSNCSDNKSIWKFPKECIPAVKEAIAEFNGLPATTEDDGLARRKAALDRMAAKDISEEQRWERRTNEVALCWQGYRDDFQEFKKENHAGAKRITRIAFAACQYDLKGKNL